MTRILKYVFGAVSIGLCVLSILLPYADFWGIMPWQEKTVKLLGIGIVFFVLQFILLGYCRKQIKVKIDLDKCILILCFILVPIQMYLVYSYSLSNFFDSPYWDAHIIFEDVIRLAKGNTEALNNEYFQFYPHNVFTVGIFSNILLYTRFLNIGNDYLVIVFFQSVLYNISGYLLYKCCSCLFGRKIAIICYSIFLILVWLSPYVLVPYTDSLGLIFPILIVYFYLRRKETQYYRYTIAYMVVAAIGYRIKPQIVIPLIAICIVTILFDRGTLLRKLKYVLTLLVICSSTWYLISHFSQSLGYSLDKDQAVPVVHYLAMGHNNITDGAYLHDDFIDTSSIKTPEIRKKMLLNKYIDRIKSLKIKGLVKLYIKKLQYSYTDGTFALWTYGVKNKDRNIYRNQITQFTQEIFSSDGTYFLKWADFLQMVWIPCLFFVPFGVLQKKISNTYKMIMLTIIGLVMFTLLFESGARYTFIFVPIFIVSAGYGLTVIDNLLLNHVKKSKRLDI